MTSRHVLFSLLATLILVGAGCKSESPARPSATNEPVAWLPPEAENADTNQTNLEELRAAIEAFQTSKSYRAKLYIDNQNGKTTGQIDVVKPDRFRGVLQIPKQNSSAEMIGIGETLYLKLPDQSWLQVDSPALASAMTEAFRGALQGDNALIQSQLPDGTTVTKKRDPARACDRYETVITPADEDPINLTVCVANERPTLIDVRTEDGTVNVEYFDYNALFTIEKPTARRITP